MAEKTSTTSPTRSVQAQQRSSGRTRQRAKNQAAIRLLNQWLADESGYDETAWPIAKRAIDTHRLSDRPRFHD
jgi:hypothetical protein